MFMYFNGEIWVIEHNCFHYTLYKSTSDAPISSIWLATEYGTCPVVYVFTHHTAWTIMLCRCRSSSDATLTVCYYVACRS
jgi:hypothetical protein